MLAVLCAAGWTGVQQLISPLTATTAPCESTTVTGTLTSDLVVVKVYNTGSKRGLAASLQTQLKGKGFYVPAIGNKTPSVSVTTIIGGTGDAPEVRLVQGFFPGSTTEGDDRKDGSVDVLVGDDYDSATGFDDQAPTSIDVVSAVICTPSGQVTSTASPINTGGPSTPPTSTDSTPPTPSPTTTTTKK